MLQRRKALAGLALLPLTPLLTNCGGGASIDTTSNTDTSGSGTQTIGQFTSTMNGSVQMPPCGSRTMTINASGRIEKSSGGSYKAVVTLIKDFGIGVGTCSPFSQTENHTFAGSVISSQLICPYSDKSKDYTLTFNIAGGGSAVYNHRHLDDLGQLQVGQSTGSIATTGWVWA